MRKRIFAGIAAAVLCLLCAAGCSGVGVDKKKADYEKIETLTRAVDDVAFEQETYQLDRNKIYVYEIGKSFKGQDDFSERLKAKLGDDFQGELSNGDHLYVKVQISNKNDVLYPYYKILAGGYQDENMIYPTWNYSKLPQSDEVSFEGLAAEKIK